MKKSSLFIIGVITAAITYGSLVAAVGPKDRTHVYHGYHHHGWHHHHDDDGIKERDQEDKETWELKEN